MQNPLKKYKEENIDMEWKCIAEKSAIPLQTLMSILKRDENTVGAVSLATHLTLLDKLGVDLSKYYKNTTEKAVGK